VPRLFKLRNRQANGILALLDLDELRGFRADGLVSCLRIFASVALTV
jgi:hypothetical protein